jgi:hypothetical protein
MFPFLFLMAVIYVESERKRVATDDGRHQFPVKKPMALLPCLWDYG